MNRLSLFGLSLILVVYLALGSLYAVNTPAWQVPDEPAHYNYIRHIVTTGTLPVLQAGDYDQQYLGELTSKRFPPELSIEPVRYEAWQPPLYYLLAAPVYWLFGGALLPLRLFSLLLGAGALIFLYLALAEFSTHAKMPLLALLATGFAAFIPQHLAMLAGVNNDALSELLIALGLWLMLRDLPQPRGGWRIGLVMGLAFVTKTQAYVLAPLAALLLLFIWRRQGWGNWRPMLERALIIFGPALLIGALGWGRNLAVYGWPDVLGAIRHDEVVRDQPRTWQWLQLYGGWGFTQRFWQTTFQSFWGQFGWMGVVMDARIYWALLAYTLGLAAGALYLVKRFYAQLVGLEREGMKILLAAAAFTPLLYCVYNLNYVQHQGRYLFPALVPLSLAAALGLWQWAHWLSAWLKRSPHRAAVEVALAFGPVALMAALDVLALYRFIIPALTL